MIAMIDSTILPDKASELIRMALRDLELVEGNPRYHVCMNEWHRPQLDTCWVCLAGAVMAMSLNCKPYEYSTPFHYSGSTATQNKLTALNEFRIGRIEEGTKLMYGKAVLGLDRAVVRYGHDPNQFKVEMNRIADDLDAAGY